LTAANALTGHEPGAQMTAMKDERGKIRKASSTVVTSTGWKPGSRFDAETLNARSGTPLQLLLAQAMINEGRDGQPLSLREIEQRTGRAGSATRLSRAAISKILAGHTTRLRPETIRGLSKALRLEEAQIVEAMEQSQKLTMELPKSLKKLSPEGMQKLLEYGRFLLSQEGK